MKLTRVHFKFIAATINSLVGLCADDKLYVAKVFADHLARTNPAFSRERFIEACIKQDEKER